MPDNDKRIAEIYNRHSRQVLATLIRVLGDFALAEEAMQEAFVAAIQQWPEEGEPDSPVAWLIQTGKRRGIDRIRRKQTAEEYARLVAEPEPATGNLDETGIADDRLRLLFTCCHPGLALEARIALTLREMCGLSTEQVARALLQKPATLAQRIVRAKRKIRDAAIPYEVPEARELPERLPGVLRVVYLVFNEAYSQTEGERIVDVDLSAEAIRLAQSLAALLPQGEVYGLLALMLLQDSRRHARQDHHGDLITLEDQDRSLWDQAQIQAGLLWLEQALALSPTGPYTLQASIAAVHARAESTDTTDWQRIANLYQALYQIQPSPIIALNRAVAIAMRDGPQAGLDQLDGLAGEKILANYHLYHAARADLHRRAGNHKAAADAYRQAIALTNQLPEKRFLQHRLEKLGSL